MIRDIRLKQKRDIKKKQDLLHSKLRPQAKIIASRLAMDNYMTTTAEHNKNHTRRCSTTGNNVQRSTHGHVTEHTHETEDYYGELQQ